MHQQEQSETKLIAVLICHLQFKFCFSIHTTLVVIHIVCVCVCVCVCVLGEWCWNIQKLPWLLLSQHYRGERGSLKGRMSSREPIPISPPLFSFSVSASAGLAVIAKLIRPGHSVCLNVLSNIWTTCSAWFISDRRTGLTNKDKSSTTHTFKVFKTT